MAKLSALTKDTAGMNSGVETLAKLVKLSGIRLHSDFESLFMINPTVQAQVVSRIKKYGYDKSQPIHIWKEEQVLIDGHTRRIAAIECGLFDIPAYEHSFESVEDALEYALGLQTARRNLTDAEIVNAIGKLDQLKKTGQRNGEKGKSAEHLSKILGTSTSKIERARTLEKKASEEVKSAVANGKISIYSAYQKVKTTQPKETEENSEQINQGVVRMKNEHQKLEVIKPKETKEAPWFYLSDILDVLHHRKLYSLAFILFDELTVDEEVQRCFIKTLPEKVQKSFELEMRSK